MNSADITTPQTRAIVVEHDLPYAPEKVWRALTEADLLAKWLMPNDIQPMVGHHFTFQTAPAPGFDGVARCEILQAEPYTRLRYTFVGGSPERQGYGAFLDTIISWTLTPTPSGGTLLRLEHSGFTESAAFAYENMGRGWARLGEGKLSQVLASLDATA